MFKKKGATYKVADGQLDLINIGRRGSLGEEQGEVMGSFRRHQSRPGRILFLVFYLVEINRWFVPGL